MSDGKEQVNHPSHYTETSIECIDAMRMTFGTERVVMWGIMTAYKYLWRRNLKDKIKEDIDKAGWYLDYAEDIIASNVIVELEDDILDRFAEVKNYYVKVFNEEYPNE